MSTQIEQNTTDLQAILDAVNALPEAGSGSGGATIETCTVSIDSSVRPQEIVYLTALGEFVYWEAEMPFDVPSPFECLCGSIIFIKSSYTMALNGAELAYGDSGYKLILVTASEGETVTISASA